MSGILIRRASPLEQGLLRINPFAQIYQIVGTQLYRIFLSATRLGFKQAPRQHALGKAALYADPLLSFSRAYWPVVHPAGFLCDMHVVINLITPKSGREASVLAYLRLDDRLARSFCVESNWLPRYFWDSRSRVARYRHLPNPTQRAKGIGELLSPPRGRYMGACNPLDSSIWDREPGPSWVRCYKEARTPFWPPSHFCTRICSLVQEGMSRTTTIISATHRPRACLPHFSRLNSNTSTQRIVAPLHFLRIKIIPKRWTLRAVRSEYEFQPHTYGVCQIWDGPTAFRLLEI